MAVMLEFVLLNKRKSHVTSISKAAEVQSGRLASEYLDIIRTQYQWTGIQEQVSGYD
jgi:hypothetical protein